MKRILTYISVFASLLFVSCSDHLEFKQGQKDVLSFTAKSSELQTRAVAGDDAYNENTIKTVEWFFFKDAEGTVLLHKEHSDGPNLRIETPEGSSYADLRYKSYLYAVANITLPAEPEGGWTLEKLLAIPVSTNFTKTATDDEGSEAQVLDKGNFNFIMDSYDENRQGNKYLMELVPTDIDDVKPIDVNLSRLAVKFTTKVKIAKEVVTTDSFNHEETWTPVLSQRDFDVYMVDALKAGYLNGEPVRRAEATDAHITDSYFTYGRNLATVEHLEDEDDDDFYVWQNVDPFYTYPQTWNGEDNREPFIKIIFPWMSDVKGSSEFHYKIVLPAPEYTAADPDDENSKAQIKFTLSRNTWYQVTATIKVLGGTENDYVLVDEVYYSVADWADPKWTSGSGLSSPVYFLVPQTTFHIYSLDTFDIPYYCDDKTTVQAYFTNISFNDYSVAPTQPKGGDITGKPTTVTSGGTGKRAWSDSSRPYTVEVTTDKEGNKVVRFTHSMEEIYVQREIHIEIYKNDSKKTQVTIYQHPAIELKKAVDSEGNLRAGDLFVNGRFVSVKNATFGQEYNGSYHSTNGWSNSIGRSGYHGITNSGLNGYGNLIHPDDITWIDKPCFITDITVSAFSDQNNYFRMSINQGTEQKVYYKIGDPRVKASSVYNPSASAPFNENWTLAEYLIGEQINYYSTTDNTENWTNPGDILIASNDANTSSMIAPHILISSGLTEVYLNDCSHDYTSFAKRAATYQEAGYPAGRWRLPTEAEVAFIAARQYDGTIPAIFNTDVTYFTSSGRFVVIPSDRRKGLMYFTYDQLNRTATACNSRSTYAELIDAKFVYDLWYWGDKPMSTNQYHPNMHIESN